MAKITVKEQEDYLKKLLKYGDRIKTDKTLVDEILNEHLKNIPHKKLYKFRTCSNQNFKILEENCIWMPPANNFEDKLDCRINIDLKGNEPLINKWFWDVFPIFIFEILEKVAKDKGYSLPCNVEDFRNGVNECVLPSGKIEIDNVCEFVKPYLSPEEKDNYEEIVLQIKQCYYQVEALMKEESNTLCDVIIETINQTKTYLRDNTLVYCMTERYNNNNLWEKHANHYSGFCIEYSFENYGKVDFDIYKNLVYLLPMVYRRKIPYFNIVPFMDMSLRKHLFNENVFDDNQEILTQLNMQLFYKDKDYDKEHEWRFTIKNKNNSKQPFPFVSAIYAGRDIKPRNLNRLLKIAKKLEVPVYKQEISQAKNSYDYKLVKESAK